MYLKTPPLTIAAILLLSLQYVIALPSTDSNERTAKSRATVGERDDDAEFESFLAYLEQKALDDADDDNTFFQPRHVIENYLKTLEKNDSDVPITPKSQD